MDKHKKWLSEHFGLPKDKIELLPGGWRKETYLIHLQQPKVACFLKGNFDKKKLSQALELEEKFGRRKLLGIGRFDNSWLIIFEYIDGQVKWEWNEDEAKLVGQKLAELHQQDVCHFDFKPGNIIWENDKIKAVIDFEESVRQVFDPERSRRAQDYNPDLKIKDLANTLSWVLVSGGQENAFLKGYSKAGQKIDYDQVRLDYDQVRLDYDRLNKYLLDYLTVRAKEGKKKAFLQLAKKKLADCKKRIKSKVLDLKDLAEFRERNKNKKIVFVVGAFELVHRGHFLFLESAKQTGDLLVVGVASDQSRERLKGRPHPLIHDQTRAETLAYFGIVDRVVVVDEDDILEELKLLRPDILYTAGKDWREKVRKKEEEKLLKSQGGKVIRASHQGPLIASSQLILQVAEKKISHLMHFLDKDNLLKPLLNEGFEKTDLQEQLDLFS